jgi:putative oxidoreductase
MPLTDLGLLLGRLLLAWIFLHEGYLLASHLGAALAAMGELGVPALVGLAVVALQLVGGAAIALGLLTRRAALGLGVFCVATAVMFHRHFGARNEMLHFEKDLAIAGGMTVLAACGAGRWSLDALLRARLRAR